MSNNKSKIAIFADLENPRVRNISPDKAKELLERIIQDGYEAFSKGNIAANFINELAKPSGEDSSYGVRMRLVQGIIASAMYSYETFANFLNQTAKDFKHKAEQKDKKYGSFKYRTIKKVKSIPERMRKKLGFSERTYMKSYFNNDLEKEEITRLNISSKVYSELPEIVSEIGKEFPDKNINEILELLEMNHIFSSRGNGTGKNMTFTNGRIREYGVKLQQLVHRIYYAGIIEDTPNPLSEKNLFPVSSGDTI